MFLEYVCVAIAVFFVIRGFIAWFPVRMRTRLFSHRFRTSSGVSYWFTSPPSLAALAISCFGSGRATSLTPKDIVRLSDKCENISCETPHRVTGKQIREYFAVLQCGPNGLPRTSTNASAAPLVRPLTAAYLHTCAFRAHLALFASPEFPLKVLGAVHVSNVITLRGHPPPLTSDTDAIDLHVHAVLPTFTIRFTEKGDIAFDVCTTIMPAADSKKPRRRKALLHLAAAPPFLPEDGDCVSDDGRTSPVVVFGKTAVPIRSDPSPPSTPPRTSSGTALTGSRTGVLSSTTSLGSGLVTDVTSATSHATDLATDADGSASAHPSSSSRRTSAMDSPLGACSAAVRASGAVGWVWRETATFIVPQRRSKRSGVEGQSSSASHAAASSTPVGSAACDGDATGVASAKAVSAERRQPILDPASGAVAFDFSLGRRVLEGTWAYGGAVSRAFAKVCSDYNPIHLWPFTAKLFGMRSNVAHGMYSVARVAHECAAAVSFCSYLTPSKRGARGGGVGAVDKPQCMGGEVVLRSSFVRPLFLPAPAVDFVVRAVPHEANVPPSSTTSLPSPAAAVRPLPRTPPRGPHLEGFSAAKQTALAFAVGPLLRDGRPAVVGTLFTSKNPECGGAVASQPTSRIPAPRTIGFNDNLNRAEVDPLRPL